MATFIASNTEQHPTDLAGLRGARLVTAQETEQGRRWAENKIKALTGEDQISARFMRQDFFTFMPAFKLVIAGNHKPGLRGVDEAIRRRLHLIPFNVTIPPSQTRPRAFRKAQDRMAWHPAWAIDGCLEWQRTGLAPPAAVRDATDDYLAAEDAIANWLDECCCLDKTYTERNTDLFASWKALAEKAGEVVGTQAVHPGDRISRGFVHYKDSRTRRAIFRGLAIRITP